MISTDTWWGGIFSGPLSIGLNEEKIHQLENESFLYLSNALSEEELPDEEVIPDEEEAFDDHIDTQEVV
ncbi:hypothetical protein ACQKMN_00600 [Ureibacillus composti]